MKVIVHAITQETKKMKEDSSKNNKEKEKWKKKKWNESDGACNNSRSQSEISKNDTPQNRKVKKKVEIKEVQYYYYQKFEQYTRDYYFDKESKNNDKGVAQFAHS